MALYGDKVYVGTLDAHLVALDRRTGKMVWDRKVENAEPKEGYSFTMAPLAAGGKIIIGTSGGEFGIRGFVDAYDPETGRRLWRFYTIPSPEEGGWWGRLPLTTPEGNPLPRDTAQERRDSAAYADTWKRGGGPVWTTPAYDPALGLIFFGIGNPSGVDGRIPPGDNLYTSSLAALDLASGKLRWYYQMVPHDEWDYDPASPPVLLDVPHGGATIPAVAQAGKTGWVYILDRRTGKLLRRSEPFVPQEHIFTAPDRGGRARLARDAGREQLAVRGVLAADGRALRARQPRPDAPTRSTRPRRPRPGPGNRPRRRTSWRHSRNSRTTGGSAPSRRSTPPPAGSAGSTR